MPLNNGIYISEHRANMALKLGRPLKTYESVHHIDGNKSNNDPENLQIYTWHDHSKLHTDQVAELLDIRKRIIELEEENNSLKKELFLLNPMR